MDFLNMTLGDLLDDCAIKHPDTEAIVYPKTGLRLTYKEFNEVCRRTAKGFLKMGIKKGDHIAIWATNYPEWLITMFASAKIGATLVTVNTNYKIFELEYLMKQSDSSTLILMEGVKSSNYMDILYDLCPELYDSKKGELSSKKLPFLKRVIYLDEKEYPGVYNWKEIELFGKDVSDEELDKIQKSIDVHDVVNMQYTSGTTGFPKGVMLTHYNIVNNGLNIGNGLQFTEKDRLLVCVPLFHCFGAVLATIASVTHCTTIVLIDVYSPTRVMQAIQDENCTALHGVPTMFIFMLDHPDFHKYKMPYLHKGIMAGSPCPIERMRQAIDLMGMKDIVIVYGQTEASPGCTMTTIDDTIERKVNTVGKVFPGTEAKIVDPETGETLGPNQTGEFCSRGYHIMKGYYKMPEATALAIDKDGWLHTGDLATVDEDGYYKITGRLKDMIIRGGENIYPREIEELLYTNPSVQDVQIVGVPSLKHGEEVAAFVIPNPGETLTEEDVKEFVSERMARHKVPSYVAIVDSFPMTASGKIQKFKLKDMAIEMFNLSDAANIETA